MAQRLSLAEPGSSGSVAKNIVLAAYTPQRPGHRSTEKDIRPWAAAIWGCSAVRPCFPGPRYLHRGDVFQDDTRVDGTKVHDDSAGRSTYWGLAATTIGATLHEMGHTFGLPHCKDGRGIMTRGFDRFNRVFTLVEHPVAVTAASCRSPPIRRLLRPHQRRLSAVEPMVPAG